MYTFHIYRQKIEYLFHEISATVNSVGLYISNLVI